MRRDDQQKSGPEEPIEGQSCGAAGQAAVSLSRRPPQEEKWAAARRCRGAMIAAASHYNIEGETDASESLGGRPDCVPQSEFVMLHERGKHT